MIRPATLSELEQVMDWTAEEGWNPGLDDAEVFLGADPAGFLVKEVDGALIAAISVVNHSPEFAFLGLYLCRPEFRGQGHGMDIWTAGLAHAGTRTIGMDGVPAQQANYAKSGFALVGRTIRFGGPVTGGEPRIGRAFRPDDLPSILVSDASSTGIARPAYIGPWVAGSPTRTTRVVDLPDGARAFSTSRRCRVGVKIGPLHASDRATALGLIQAAIPPGETMEIAIDIPEDCTDLIAIAEDLGLRPVFETARMYLGPSPKADPPAFYSVATPELG